MAQLASAEAPYIGTLTDHEIERLAAAGELITEQFERQCVKQACYELRAGTVYYDLPNAAQRITVQQGDYILLKPRQLAVIITMETIRIANNMLGRILTKGQLFSVGIPPVNTYADHGFYGKLGIVLYNASTSYIKINPGDAIAKIEFSRLPNDVRHPYHGQHGYQTEIWPIPTEKILSPEEIRRDKRILDLDKELELSYGPDFARVLSRISRFERPLIIGGCVYFIAMLLLMGFVSTATATTLWIAVGAGVVANVLTAIITYKATDILRRK